MWMATTGLYLLEQQLQQVEGLMVELTAGPSSETGAFFGMVMLSKEEINKFALLVATAAAADRQQVSIRVRDC